MGNKTLSALIVAVLLTASSVSLHAQKGRDYFIVENYYKVKWGFTDEFISLWKKNHYPLLKKAIEKVHAAQHVNDKKSIKQRFISWTPWGDDFEITSVKDLSKAYQEFLEYNPNMVMA